MVNAEKDLIQWVVSGHASILAGNGLTTNTLAQLIQEIVNNESLSKSPTEGCRPKIRSVRTSRDILQCNARVSHSDTKIR